VTEAEVSERELLLLEEGHCLRDQALDYCQSIRPERLASFGATSLATIMQMVANGYGVTLLPQMSAPLELRDDRVMLLRFAAPEPRRMIGLAWRRTSARKRDFVALGQIISRQAGPTAS
jgi:LysR family hydrogen peroxide-inducible transcriptional activator